MLTQNECNGQEGFRKVAAAEDLRSANRLRFEYFFPEFFHVVKQDFEPIGVERIEALLCLGFHTEEPGLQQDAEVLRDGRARHGESAGDFPSRELSDGDHPKDLAARGIRNGAKRLIKKHFHCVRVYLPLRLMAIEILNKMHQK